MRTSDCGMSLVEATVILAVVSMLTAVLAPSIRGYAQSAQQAAAKSDVEAIGSALSRFLVDVGEAWSLRDGSTGTGSTSTDHFAPDHASTKLANLLVSDGKIPGKYVSRSSGSPDWDAAVDNGKTQKLEYYLVLNTPKGDSGKAYRTAATMSAVNNFDPDDGSQYNSPYAWRGPYLTGPIGPDPWGNRYAVNVEFLARTQGTTPSGNVNDAIVLSAGNNGLIETRFDTDGVTSGNDVFFVISGGTR